MKKQIVITDLTRMYQGKVCIAGYDASHTCFRPVTPAIGLPESSLCINGKPVLYPFALVELDFIKPSPQPPHTEDYEFNPWFTRWIRTVEHREEVLQWSLYQSVEALFEQEILTGPGYYVKDCRGPRSLGTILPKAIYEVKYDQNEEHTWDYRIIFLDGAGKWYRLKIVDLTWHYYSNSLRNERTEPTEIAKQLTASLKSRKVFLRLGLSRGWKEYPDRCFLQVTGVITFPDYLEGKTFADFANRNANN